MGVGKKKLYGAGAVKPYLVGAGAGAGQNPLKRLPGAGIQAIFRGSQSRELKAGEKITGSPTLIKTLAL